MEDQEKLTPEEEADVEAQRFGKKRREHEEPRDEAEDEGEDVEAHVKRTL